MSIESNSLISYNTTQTLSQSAIVTLGDESKADNKSQRAEMIGLLFGV